MSPKAKLLAMMAAFVAPVAIAAALVFSGWQPTNTGNHGELVQPAEPVEDLGLADPVGWNPPAWRGRWQYLYVLPAEPCDAACLEEVEVVSRVRTALHRDAERLRIRLLTPYPDGLPDAVATADGVTVIALSESDHQALLQRGGVFAVHIVDPEGYRMMVHANPLDPSDLLSDTRRLLRASDDRQERALRNRADEIHGEDE